MKLEVRCSECDQAWLVEERLRHAESLCARCRERAAPALAAGRTATAVKASARAGPSAPAGTRPAAAAAVATAQPASEEIVCPRCQLHFYPRGRRPGLRDERRPTVLVVEEEGYFRELAAAALASRYEVKTASTTAEARAILAQGGIDLIVLDLTPAGGAGTPALLHELTPKPCPILIITAQDESELYGESWEQLRRLGADDLVIKGMRVAESLVLKVGQLLGRRMDDEDPLG